MSRRIVTIACRQRRQLGDGRAVVRELLSVIDDLMQDVAIDSDSLYDRSLRSSIERARKWLRS